MNGLLLLAIAAALLLTAYLVYGRYLVKTWGIDPKAKTPAYEKEDGVDYVPSNKWEVFGHQFSSIAGAGSVTWSSTCDGIWMVTCIFMGNGRRNLLWSRTRLWCSIRIC